MEAPKDADPLGFLGSGTLVLLSGTEVRPMLIWCWRLAPLLEQRFDMASARMPSVEMVHLPHSSSSNGP